MTMRVSNAQIYRSVLKNVNIGTRSLASLQEKLSTGRRVNRPSDDPSAAALALSYRADIALNDQHQRATADAVARMNASEAAMGGATDSLQRVRELAVQAGSPGISPQELQALGEEVDQLLGHMVQLGNANFAGQFLFAGHQTQTPPFTTTTAGTLVTAVNYVGDTGALKREIGVGVTVDINVAGSDAFGNVFSTLITLRDALNAGNVPVATAQIANLDADPDALLGARGRIGARANGIESAQSILTDANTELTKQKAENEEIDLVDVIVKLNSQESVYQAALASTARAIQPSLMDFLR